MQHEERSPERNGPGEADSGSLKTELKRSPADHGAPSQGEVGGALSFLSAGGPALQSCWVKEAGPRRHVRGPLEKGRHLWRRSRCSTMPTTRIGRQAHGGNGVSPRRDLRPDLGLAALLPRRSGRPTSRATSSSITCRETPARSSARTSSWPGRLQGEAPHLQALGRGRSPLPGRRGDLRQHPQRGSRQEERPLRGEWRSASSTTPWESTSALCSRASVSNRAATAGSNPHRTVRSSAAPPASPSGRKAMGCACRSLPLFRRERSEKKGPERLRSGLSEAARG